MHMLDWFVALVDTFSEWNSGTERGTSSGCHHGGVGSEFVNHKRLPKIFHTKLMKNEKFSIFSKGS